MTMLLEPSGESAAVLTALREELARVDDAIASGPPRRLDDLQTEWLRSPRLHALAVAVFGGASLLLTLAGLFARVTHGVVRRRREWALRQAIGATPGQVWQTVAREVTGVTVAGVIAGLLVLPIAAAAGRHLVYGANLLDWQRALGVGAAIAVAALLAGVAPARHATRGDLATVLRDE
jgi:ABC-type antimicrobial peptide transport system permease subunit